MADAFICDAVRTPIGRYAGGLAPVRPDDLGAVPLKALKDRNPGVDWEAVEDVIFGCANQAGEADLMLAGGVESMTRAPFVMGKSAEPFGRKAEIFDTTIGWRFVNPRMKTEHGIDSMPETAENVAQYFQVSRADQDAFAFRSQRRAGKAQAEGRFAEEIVPVTIPRRKGDPVRVEKDEHLRPDTTLEALAKLPTPFRKE